MKTVYVCDLCGFQSPNKSEVAREEKAHTKPKFKKEERVFFDEELPWRPWRRVMEIRYRPGERNPVYDLDVNGGDYPNQGRDVGRDFLESIKINIPESRITSAEEIQEVLKHYRRKKRK
ncbi:MAG: hypothetical protein WC629_00800 [Candidatus Paceibacterota bacterium]|jgi:hypothetical protein